MPRQAKGARLYLHPVERQWLIRDGSVTRRTGCGEGDRRGAEKKLGEYLGDKFRPVARESSPLRISIAEVLTAYGREHAPHTKGSSPSMAGYNIATLLGWWGTRLLSEINKVTCQAYTAHRLKSVKAASPRRELAILQAAINHWHQTHGPLDAIPVVTLPAKPRARDRWLTRTEAAMLLAGALGFYREFWSDVGTRRTHERWRRYAPGINRHLARFILIALGTGSRKAVVLQLRWLPSTTGGWVDLRQGVMHRIHAEQEQTKKRQPPVRLGRKLLAHMRRWQRLDDLSRARAGQGRRRGAEHADARWLTVISWLGRPVASVRTAWDAAVDLAWLDDKVTPHVLRHTKVTWALRAGIDRWELAGAVGMSMQMIEENYGHHDVDWQANVAEI